MFNESALRSIYRNFYKEYSSLRTKLTSRQIPVQKLLRGGENGIRAAKYAELTNNFLRPSTTVLEGPHVKLLQLYTQVGDEIFNDEIFQSTDYFQNALECMTLTGAYFYDRPEKIKILAERFIRQYKGEVLNLPQQPGQSDANQPIWVRPIKESSCYEVIDGNHRIAHAVMRGDASIPAIIYEKEPVYTPLQQLLLDCLWINKQKWLYQPLEAPELQDKWKLIRRSIDRLEMMRRFLEGQNLLSNSPQKSTYIDIGSSYGWFVHKMGELGFDAYGMERDPFGMQIGFKVYGVQKEQIIHADVARGLEEQLERGNKYDVVSCLSVLHHFVLEKSSTSAESFIKLLDKITDKVLFLDTGEEHEVAFGKTLAGWSPEFIQQWIKSHTSFNKVIPLGIDQDRCKPFENYYNRTLFACIR